MLLSTQDQIEPLSVIIDAVSPVWTTTKTFAPYMEARQGVYIRDTWSPGSQGLYPCITQLDRAALLLHSQEIKDTLGHSVWEPDQSFFRLVQKETDCQKKIIRCLEHCFNPLLIHC